MPLTSQAVTSHLVPGFVRDDRLAEGYDITVTEIDSLLTVVGGLPAPLPTPKPCWLKTNSVSRIYSRVQTYTCAAEMTAVDPGLRTLRNLNTKEDYAAALATTDLQLRRGQSGGPARYCVASSA